VTPREFDFLRKLLKERSGLVLAADKQYLVESRLMPIVRRANLANLSELVQRLRSGAEALTVDVVEAMTTNESFFFRDNTPFELFGEVVLPALMRARAAQRVIRIWCAACSTGQEPYSLAMCIREMQEQLAGWRVEILGTDISTEVLEKARTGLYSQFEVQRGLAIELLLKYFTQVGELWELSPKIRDMVQYRPLNLLENFSHLGLFDVVFCRNVLIYFDQETKVSVLNRIAGSMMTGGYLVLGAAETVVGLTDAFTPMVDRRGLYVPNMTAARKAAAGATPRPEPRLVTVTGGR
jgi:chemotaxis protein methyltransferase CheR